MSERSARGAAPGGRGPLSRHAFLSLYLPAIAIAMGQGIAAPALPLFVKDFGVSFGAATLASVLYAVGGLAGTLPTGYLIDRVGRRPVLLGGPILTALASFLVAFGSPTFEWLLVWRFLGGAANQGWELSRLAMIADSPNERERGRLLKWMVEMSAMGALVAPSIGGFAAEIDLRVPFVLYGALALVSIVPSFWLLEETDPGRAGDARRGPTAQKATWGYVLGLLFTREMLAFLVAQFLANVARGLHSSGLINLYMAYAYGASALTIGVLNTVSGAVAMPFGFASGSVIDRWGRKKTIVPGFALLFLALVGIGVTAFLASAFGVFVVAFLFMSIVQTVVGGTMQVMGADLAPAIARGRFIGAWRLVGRGGGAIGPALFGWVAELSTYAAAFGVLALCALGVSVVVGLFIGETVGRARGEEETAVSPYPPAPMR